VETQDNHHNPGRAWRSKWDDMWAQLDQRSERPNEAFRAIPTCSEGITGRAEELFLVT
jgi:hypothetical protein